jgi:Protein of unknown function (DUF2911)
MKKMISFFTVGALLISSLGASAQDKAEDKSKRPSPPAKVSQTLKSGAVVTIDYSQPSVKGRTIGKDLEPKKGEVWRTGANEATVFETSKDIKVNGSSLPAGKYALFSMADEGEWTIIFNKTFNQWGAYDYKMADDALRVKTKATKGNPSSEKFTITVDADGTTKLLWGEHVVSFMLE